MDLNTIWFILVGILLTGYAMLDGFDLGVGALHLFTKTDVERRMMLNAIGPVWDGNEVWLVTGGGALFAAFPHVYATLFSGFYSLFMLFLLGIIFRAVSIEFRSKRPEKAWRSFWDVCFSFGSILPAFLMGVMMGNVVLGIPLDDHFEYQGALWDLFNGYSVLAGVTTVLLFAMHGSIYIYLKTEGALQMRARVWLENTALMFLVSYMIFNGITLFSVQHVQAVVGDRPHITVILIVNLAIVLSLFFLIKFKQEFLAFIASCFAMMTLMALFGATMYPDMVFSVPDLENSLTIYNASSTSKTLTIMLIIAAIGVPIVLTYTISIYWIFRGKVQLTDEGY